MGNRLSYVIQKEDYEDEGICVFNFIEQRYYCLDCVNPIDVSVKPVTCPYCGKKFTRYIN